MPEVELGAELADVEREEETQHRGNKKMQGTRCGACSQPSGELGEPFPGLPLNSCLVFQCHPYIMNLTKAWHTASCPHLTSVSSHGERQWSSCEDLVL